MSTRLGLLLSLAIPLLVPATPMAAQGPPAAAQWLPPEAVISLHVSQPRKLIKWLAGAEMTEAITALPLYQQQVSKPQFREFLNLVAFLETTLDTDWQTGLARLTGGGITLAICPEDTVVAIVDAEDERLLERLHEIFLNIARSEAENEGRSGTVASKEYAGVTVWTFDGEEAHAIIGKRFIFANRSEGLKAVLDLRNTSAGASLSTTSAYRAATQAASADAVANAFVHVAPLMDLPGVAELLDKSRANPLAALVFAGISEAVRSSSWLNLTAHIDDKALAVQALTDGKLPEPTSPVAFALPQKASDAARANLSVPGRIAAVSLYRDLHRFYAGKDDLFPERTSGLIFFENMMGIFFTGRDLTSEVLAQTEPEVRLVVAEQRYDPAVGTPQVRLPAVAAILRLRDPEQFKPVVEEAWQKAVGLINFTRGQQALPGLIIDRPMHAGTRFTVAYFSTVDVEDKTKLNTRFNLRPALAMPGEHLILSSTDGLARDLIEALSPQAEPAAAPTARTHSVLDIEGAHAASALQANRETLVRGDMVKKGRTQAEAETGIDMLITLVKLMDRLKLSIGARDGLIQAQLRVKLNLPDH